MMQNNDASILENPRVDEILSHLVTLEKKGARWLGNDVYLRPYVPT